MIQRGSWRGRAYRRRAGRTVTVANFAVIVHQATVEHAVATYADAIDAGGSRWIFAARKQIMLIQCHHKIQIADRRTARFEGSSAYDVTLS